MLEIQLPPIDLPDVRQQLGGIPPILSHQRRENAQQPTLTEVPK